MLLCSIIADVRQADGDDPRTVEMCQACEADLHAEIADVLHAAPSKRRQLENRARRANKRVLSTVAGEQFGSVVLGVRLLMERLIAEGQIVLHAGSRFDHAWSRFAEAIENSPEAGALDNPERRGDADRLCRGMRQRLGKMGYYNAMEAVT